MPDSLGFYLLRFLFFIFKILVKFEYTDVETGYKKMLLALELYVGILMKGFNSAICCCLFDLAPFGPNADKLERKVFR